MSIKVIAPLSGTVDTVSVAVGDLVTKGSLLLILESMKVHIQVTAQCSGIIESLEVAKSDSVKRDDLLLTITALPASDSVSNNEPITEPNEVHQEHSSLAAHRQRSELTSDEHRVHARDRRHLKGYRTARENLASLCDPHTFKEYGQFAVAAQRGRQDYEQLKTTTAADGIITGVGSVNADLFDSSNNKTAIIVNDYSVLAGTQGYFHHLKLDRIFEVARRKKLPVIMFTEGGGGRPGDTDITTINSGLACLSFSNWAGLAGLVPRITVANGYNFAGNAALFGAGDITIATKNSWIGMAGPAMISGGGLGEVKPTNIGPIDVQAQNGVVDIVADDEAHAAKLAKKIVTFFQGNLGQGWQATEQTGLRAAMPENRKLTYSVRDILTRVADIDSFVELKAMFGRSIITGFMRIEGKAVGVIANDCTVLGGAIDVDAGEKATDFMQLCHQFSIPMVSFCDTPGFMVGPEHEKLGAVRRLSKLFTAGAQFTGNQPKNDQLKTPFISVVLRKCYGLGAQAMLGGHTQRPDYTIAWPTGEFGPMGLEGAVTLGFKKELAAIENDAERQALFDSLLAKQYERGAATEVASTLEIDAVIDPADTRTVLASII